MSLFNTKDFERQGNSENDIQLDNADDTREAIIQLSSTALRSIKIFTPDFEHDLYDNDELRKALLQFTRGNRHAQIQILVSDLSKAIHYGHRLIRLAQQLTSVMQIKNTPEDYQDTNIGFILIDQTSFIFKADASKQPAVQSECKNRANKLNEFFTPAWEHAQTDPQIRRILI